MSQPYSPFPRINQLNHELDFLTQQEPIPASSTLPGQPCIHMADTNRLYDFLEREFCATDLEKMAPHLWTMSTQSSANISPLHHQRVKGREIIVTEDPQLHLVWIHRCIFIKPLPPYLLAEPFWIKYLHGRQDVFNARECALRRAALGYLRTYCYLIRHESDFHIAQDQRLRLVPMDATWAQVAKFMAALSDIKDSDVSGRYAYGELRLTRLNFWAKIFLRKWFFMQIYGQYDAYFSRFYGPLLFVFGVLSILLNSLQLEMAVEQVVSTVDNQWQGMWWFCRWISVIFSVAVVALGLGLILVLAMMIANEWTFALKARCGKKRKAMDEL